MGKLVSFPFIYRSEPLQMFIRGSADYQKAALVFKQPAFSVILENFKQAFPEVQGFVLTNDTQAHLTQVLAILQESLSKVKAFKKTCKSNVLSFYRFEEGIVNLSTGINQITHFFYPTKEMGVELSKRATNPYKVLLDWARKESLEIESLIEAVEKKFYFDGVLSKSHSKFEKQQQGLENFQSGKKSFFQRLSKKPNEVKSKELESEVKDSENELMALQEIVRIATGRLIEVQVPFFQEKEVEKLESTIRCYSGLIVEEYNDFITHFTNIQESITPLVI